jgi:hypothetical protein
LNGAAKRSEEVCENLYNQTVDRPPKLIEFRGCALEDLSRFPAAARRKARYQSLIRELE